MLSFQQESYAISALLSKRKNSWSWPTKVTQCPRSLRHLWNFLCQKAYSQEKPVFGIEHAKYVTLYSLYTCILHARVQCTYMYKRLRAVVLRTHILAVLDVLHVSWFFSPVFENRIREVWKKSFGRLAKFRTWDRWFYWICLCKGLKNCLCLQRVHKAEPPQTSSAWKTG